MPRLAFRSLLPVLFVVALACAACDSNEDENLGPAVASDVVTVAYQGRLADSTIFDQSPRATFSLQNVIPGFRDGIVGMMVDSTRTFDVPPEAGYGEDGVTNPETGDVVVPPGATLTFDVTLLDIR